MKKGKILLLAAVLVLALAQVAFPALRAVGPVLPDADGNPLTAPWSAGFNGFPQWYRDSLGQTVALVPADPVSLADPVLGGNDFSAQIGFGSEAFYWDASATIDPVPGVVNGQALLVMGLEAAFSQGDAAPGDQITFARIRIRIDIPLDGDYIVTHPYGTRRFNGLVIDPQKPGKEINETIDIGVAPGVFTGALKGGIGPFLKQVVPAAPAGYLGDLTPATVTGGTNGNIFRVQRVGGGLDIQTSTFAVGGKLFTGVPFTVARTTFSRDAAGGNKVAEVFATTPLPLTPGIIIDARLPGQAAFTPLTRVGNAFFGSFAFTNTLPAQVEVRGRGTNLTPTSQLSSLVDTITINQATYHTVAKTLTIAATSSDGQATLRAFGFAGATAAGQLMNVAQGAPKTFSNVTIPPVSITVKSALGGSASLKTVIVP